MAETGILPGIKRIAEASANVNGKHFGSRQRKRAAVRAATRAGYMTWRENRRATQINRLIRMGEAMTRAEAAFLDG